MVKTPAQPKTRKVVEVVVLVPYFFVLMGAALLGGVALGYFGGINLHSEARQAVYNDIEVSKTSASK